MTAEDRCPVVHFDHNSAEHAADAAGSYRRLRTTDPVAYTDAHGGYWVLSGYQAVFDAARNDDVFSSARSSHGGEGLTVTIPKTPMHHHIPIEIDPPDFRKYRKILNAITSPAAIVDLIPRIQHHTTWFIDRIIEQGRCDFAEIIGVPAITTVEWLGLPTEEWARYSFQHRTVLSAPKGSPDYVKATEVDLPYLTNQVREVIAARRARPEHDIISHLLAQEVDDRPLTDDEVFSMVELLLAGGTVTTTSLVSQALVWLYRHPDVRRRLIDEPDLRERAIEEFLRYFSPTQALARTITTDTEFHGCPLRAGDRALLAWASANRDPAGGFEQPDELDIERWPNRHLGFGVGIHRCAGSHVARALAMEMIGQILDRMPDFVVETRRMVPFLNQGANTGFSSIPVTFTPGPRLLAEL
jgi:cytochrome P450